MVIRQERRTSFIWVIPEDIDLLRIQPYGALHMSLGVPRAFLSGHLGIHCRTFLTDDSRRLLYGLLTTDTSYWAATHRAVLCRHGGGLKRSYGFLGG